MKNVDHLWNNKAQYILFAVLLLSLFTVGCRGDKKETVVLQNAAMEEPGPDDADSSVDLIQIETVPEETDETVENEPSEDYEKASEEVFPEDYPSLVAKETITIYDIEEGYLEVPYYPELPQCEYDWTRLKLDGQILEYDDTEYDTMLGVDVSKFQGDVDWEKVRAQGFEFAMIRLGYRGYGNGRLVTDEFFDRNIRKAHEAGLEIGVYFLSQALNEKEAVEEAEYVVSELEKYEDIPVSFPVVVDSERIKFDVSRTESMNGAERTDTILAFCETVEDAGYRTALYANSQWLTEELDIRRLTDTDIWYADYQIFDNDEAPLYPYPFIMWQYTNMGRIEGISGNADISIYFKRQ